MICFPPKCFDQYTEFVSTSQISIKHLVVKVANTPPDALAELREWDRKMFEYDGEHAIEFLEE